MHCLTNTLYTPEAPPTVIIPSPRGEPVDPDAPPPGPIVIPEQVREFQQEFESALPLLEGTSLTRRPDAVSVDYQFAFCLGPIDYGDGTQGANVKVWRAYVEGNAIYVAREDDAGTGWRD